MILLQLFAAALPDAQGPEAIGFVLLALGGMFLALNQGADFFARFRKTEPSSTTIDGQPIEVKAVERYATKEELKALEERLSERQAELEHKLDDMVDKLGAQGEDRVRRLHARMDDVLKAVATVQGELRRIPGGGT